jgi:hypothetical protein
VQKHREDTCDFLRAVSIAIFEKLDPELSSVNFAAIEHFAESIYSEFWHVPYSPELKRVFDQIKALLAIFESSCKPEYRFAK